MSYQFVLASGNPHKAKEFSNLFNGDIVRICPPPEKQLINETGTSFRQNALLKAEGYFQKLKVPVLADDSGLEVFALSGEMGVYSARFGGEGLSDRERALLLLEKLVNEERRGACFICVLCFYLSPKEIFFFEGRMKGSVSREYRGQDGFGYDPVFVPLHHEGEETLAEIPDWKAQYSHRAKAVGFSQSFFRGRP